MLPTAFQGERIEVNKVRPDQTPELSQNALQPLQITMNDPPPSTVTFQGSYDVAKPSTFNDKVPRSDPQPLVG